MSEKVWNITKYAIAQYAQAVENLEPMYLNEKDAQQAGFETTIAPTSLCAQYQGGVHTKQKMFFFKPIQAGDALTARTEVAEGADAKGRLQITYTTTFTNQNGEVVCSGVMTNLVPGARK